MFIALTGTPGTGKTKIARQLRKLGYEVIGLNSVIKRNNYVLGKDKERNTIIVDIDKLKRYIRRIKREMDADFVFLEGHLSHLLPVDIAIVLRCEPNKLRNRLRRKRYSKRKIEENVEAEILDAILIEAVGLHKKVFEIDTTKLSVAEARNRVISIIQGHTKRYCIGRIDWSKEILKRY